MSAPATDDAAVSISDVAKAEALLIQVHSQIAASAPGDDPTTSSLEQLTSQLATLIEKENKSGWELGRCLCALRAAGQAAKKFDDEYLTFEALIVHKFNFSLRRAERLMANYKYLEGAGVDESTVNEVGSWTKLSLLTSHTTPENLPHWLEYAKSHSYRQLREALTVIKTATAADNSADDTDTSETFLGKVKLTPDEVADIYSIASAPKDEKLEAAMSEAHEALTSAEILIKAYRDIALKAAKTEGAKKAAESAHKYTSWAINALDKSWSGA